MSRGSPRALARGDREFVSPKHERRFQPGLGILAAPRLPAACFLRLFIHISSHLIVWPRIIARRLADEAIFFVTGEMMDYLQERGVDRQAMHEQLRKLTEEATIELHNGGMNTLAEKILGDATFGIKQEELAQLMLPERLIGRAPQQTTDFLEEFVQPLLAHEDADVAVCIEV
jgi:adenylosuccinate lyase